MKDRPRVLVVDDGENYAAIVSSRLPEYQLVTSEKYGQGNRIADGPSAIAFLEHHAGEVDVVLLDVQFDIEEDRLFPLAQASTPRRIRRFQGVAILQEIRKRHPGLPVVMLTAQADLSLVDAGGEVASQSMTYFLDGDDLDSLRIRINQALLERQGAPEESGVLWGADPAFRAIRRRLTVLSRGKLPIILEGETGTGKSFLAEQFIHRNSGRSGLFVALDLSTIPRDLVAAHLFGAMKGAYTGAVADRKGVFEMANRGTLFLDEVQNIPLEVQRQLLLVLQDRRVRPLGAAREVEVDVKVIAASNTSLSQAVFAGLFRHDLYMRLSPATAVTVPPLRQRAGDLAFLSRRFVQRAVEEAENREFCDRIATATGQQGGAPLELLIPGSGLGRTAGLRLKVPKPAWELLESHTWPGNIRELEMVMHNLVTFTLVDAADALQAGLSLTSGTLQVDAGLVSTLLSGSAGLRAGTQGAGPAGAADPDRIAVTIEPGKTLNAVSNSVERQYMTALYRETGGDFALMADALLGDPGKARAVRLRFNQLGLKVREIALK